MPKPVKSTQYDLDALNSISGDSSNSSVYSPTFDPWVNNSDLGIDKSSPLPKQVVGGAVQAGANFIPSAGNQIINMASGPAGIIQLLSRAIQERQLPPEVKNKISSAISNIKNQALIGTLGTQEGIVGDLAHGVVEAIGKYDPRGGFESPLSKTLRFDPAAPIADAASLYAMKEGGPSNLWGDAKGIVGDLHQTLNDFRARQMLKGADDTFNLRLGLPDSTVSDVVTNATKSGDSIPISILAGDKKGIEKLAATPVGRQKLKDLTSTQFGQAENAVQTPGLEPNSQLSLTEGSDINSEKLRQRVNTGIDQLPESNTKFKTEQQYATGRVLQKFGGDLDKASTADLIKNWTSDPKTFASLDALPGMQPEVKESILNYKVLKAGLQPDGSFSGKSVVNAVDANRDLYNDPALRSIPGYSERMASFQTLVHTMAKMDAVPSELRAMNALQMDSARNRFNIIMGGTMSALTGSKFGELRAATGVGNEMLSFSRSDFAKLTTNPEANWILNNIAGKSQSNSALRPAVQKLVRIAGTMNIPATIKVGDAPEQKLISMQEVQK